LQFYRAHIQKNPENAVRNYLKSVFAKLPPGRTLKAVDRLNNGTRIHVEIRICEDGSADFDFTCTGAECLRNGNAPKSVCLSAIIYCLRCLINYDIPLNQGCLASINVVNPYGSILNPSENAAVYAGNTQTSQRLVGVVLEAFEVRPKKLCFPGYVLTLHRLVLRVKDV
jgi:5-oxoprolinase (ATP-hydrolysing)